MSKVKTVLDESGRNRYVLEYGPTLVDILRTSVDRNPEGIAVYDGDSTLTWGALDAKVELLARRLRATGIEAGDRVALLGGNETAFIVGAFAIWRAGAVLVPLNNRLSSGELATLIDDADCRILLTTTEFEGRAAEAAGQLRFAVHDGVEWLPEVEPLKGVFPEVKATSPAAIIYTSGTTGRPKGVVISHDNAIQNSGTCTETIGRLSSDREIIMVPIFNVTGLCSQLVPAIALGMSVILCGAFNPSNVLAAIQQHGATSTVGAPTMWWRLLEAAAKDGSTSLSGLRLALFGGAPMPTALLSRMREAMPHAEFGNGYGQTETCSMVTYVGGDAVISRPETVGPPLPITDARIVDPETGADVPEGSEGELLVRGPQIAEGYRVNGSIVPIADANGWVSTGDLAVIDQGYVVLRDRLKDVIKRGGESIYSFEVEDSLAQHPDVLEVAVVGLPDPELGEIVAAAFVLKPGSTFSPEGIRAQCADKLAHFKLPKVMIQLDQLPRNAGGKVLKRELRELIQTQTQTQ